MAKIVEPSRWENNKSHKPEKNWLSADKRVATSKFCTSTAMCLHMSWCRPALNELKLGYSKVWTIRLCVQVVARYSKDKIRFVWNIFLLFNWLQWHKTLIFNRIMCNWRLKVNWKFFDKNSEIFLQFTLLVVNHVDWVKSIAINESQLELP